MLFRSVNWLVVARDKPRKGFFRAGPQLRNESRFVGLERQRAGNIAHGEVRLQISVLPHYLNDRTLGICQSRHLLKKGDPVPTGIQLRPLARAANVDRRESTAVSSARETEHSLICFECPARSIVLDTGTPLKCSRSRLFSITMSEESSLDVGGARARLDMERQVLQLVRRPGLAQNDNAAAGQGFHDRMQPGSSYLDDSLSFTGRG